MPANCSPDEFIKYNFGRGMSDKRLMSLYGHSLGEILVITGRSVSPKKQIETQSDWQQAFDDSVEQLKAWACRICDIVEQLKAWACRICYIDIEDLTHFTLGAEARKIIAYNLINRWGMQQGNIAKILHISGANAVSQMAAKCTQKAAPPVSAPDPLLPPDFAEVAKRMAFEFGVGQCALINGTSRKLTAYRHQYIGALHCDHGISVDELADEFETIRDAITAIIKKYKAGKEAQ